MDENGIANNHNDWERKNYLELNNSGSYGRLQSILMKGAAGQLDENDIIRYKDDLIRLFEGLLIPGGKIFKNYKPEDDIPRIDELFKDDNIEKGLTLKSVYQNHMNCFFSLLFDTFLDLQIDIHAVEKTIDNLALRED